MKKYFNISLAISITLIITSVMSFINYFQTGCTSGRWGFGSCGKASILLPIVSLISGLCCLYFSLSSVKSTVEHMKNKDKL